MTLNLEATSIGRLRCAPTKSFTLQKTNKQRATSTMIYVQCVHVSEVHGAEKQWEVFGSVKGTFINAREAYYNDALFKASSASQAFFLFFSV